MTTPALLVTVKEPDTQKGSIARPQLSGAVVELIEFEPTWWEFPDGRRRALHVEKEKRG